jgi:hypothetical protein
MSINFVCRCGKRLRAREDMASRRIMCPRCGEPVGVPSLEATHRGGAGPLTREEIALRAQAAGPRPLNEAELGKVGPVQVRLRRRRTCGNLAAGPDWRPLEAPLVCPPGAPGAPERVRLPRRRRQWARESRWYHCLLYPLRALGLVLGLGLPLTALTGIATLAAPQLNEADAPWAPYLFALIPVLVLAYTAGFLDVVLTTAATGQFGDICWPGYDVPGIGYSALKWLVCFLAGPVVLAAAAVLFWVFGDEPRFVDRAILAELVVLSLGAWCLGLLSATDAGRLAGAAPGNVVALTLRLGWRAVVPLAVAPGIMIAHARLGLAGLAEIHRDGPLGTAMLAGAWVGILFWCTFLFRLFGIWCHDTRTAGVSEDATA